MGIFFGTDGIRGVVNQSLTFDLAYKCGNAVGSSLKKPTIIIGADTRTTGSFLITAFSGGAMSAGANVIDVGVCPTAGIAYITKRVGADYGVVISASHNPAEYNGIKIFDKNGFKLGDKNEENLERRFIHEANVACFDLGTYKQDFSLTKLYEDYLISCSSIKFNGLTILLDGSNGAAHKIAPSVFRSLGAKVIATHCRCDGKNINNNCGSLNPEVLAKAVKKYKADMGFAFDGDADRIIACDKNGDIIDGDIIIFMLAKYLKQNGRLAKNTVVGTRHTNMGLEEDLNKEGISLLRTDIGDKYVIQKIEEEELSLGGEKSGHVIFRELATTGDGILTGIKIAEMVKTLGKKISELAKVNLYPQININCVVADKIRIINSEKLDDEINNQQNKLGESSRIMVRYSGTEDKIRIMVEHKSKDAAIEAAKVLEKIIYEIDAQGQ